MKKLNILLLTLTLFLGVSVQADSAQKYNQIVQVASSDNNWGEKQKEYLVVRKAAKKLIKVRKKASKVLAKAKEKMNKILAKAKEKADKLVKDKQYKTLRIKESVNNFNAKKLAIAKKKANKIWVKAKKKADKILAKAKKKADKKLAKARKKAAKKLAKAQRKLKKSGINSRIYQRIEAERIAVINQETARQVAEEKAAQRAIEKAAEIRQTLEDLRRLDKEKAKERKDLRDERKQAANKIRAKEIYDLEHGIVHNTNHKK
jgi:hypothetical protein